MLILQKNCSSPRIQSQQIIIKKAKYKAVRKKKITRTIPHVYQNVLTLLYIREHI